MTSATIAARRNQNLYRQPAKVQLGPTSATFVVIAIISILALFYLNQITKTNVFSYRLNTLSSQQTQLLNDKQDLSVEAARLQSLNTIKNSAVVAKMVPVSQVTYAK